MSAEFNLHSYQREFANYLLSEDKQTENLFASLIESEVLLTDTEVNYSSFIKERIGIYRNNVYYSLTQSLGSLYPVVKRLVGEGFFQLLAKDYIQIHPPSTPVIAFYGEYFAEFVSLHERCSSLKYLSSVAKLEWNCHRALNAPDDDPVKVDELLVVGEDKLAELILTLRESAILMCSQYPVDQIWYENQRQEVSEISFTGSDEVHLLVYRKDSKVVVVTLNSEVYLLLELLQSGQVIGDAWEVVSRTSKVKSEELTGILVYLLGLEVFGGIKIDAETSI